MIDGISGGGGPRPSGLREPIGQRRAPDEITGANITGANIAGAKVTGAGITASEPARSLRRVAPASDSMTTRTGRSALVTDMAKAPPVNAARVADLKARIDAGTYTVDPLRIADAMLKLDRGRP